MAVYVFVHHSLLLQVAGTPPGLSSFEACQYFKNGRTDRNSALDSPE
jgi:hypothetical protein